MKRILAVLFVGALLISITSAKSLYKTIKSEKEILISFSGTEPS